MLIATLASVQSGTESIERHPQGRKEFLDLVSIAVTAVVWGTTWFAITLQLGVVDPIVSLVYRWRCSCRRASKGSDGAPWASRASRSFSGNGCSSEPVRAAVPRRYAPVR